jgi:hypothetical protein
MRYLLLVLGLLALGLGIYVICYGPVAAYSNGVVIALVGSIFFAAGGATLDIVEAIQRLNNK